MIRAVWNGTVLAEAPRTVRVEGNHYFPPESLHREHLIESPTTSICPWKGLAHYYNVVVDGPYGQLTRTLPGTTAGPVHWLAGSKTMLRSGTV